MEEETVNESTEESLENTELETELVEVEGENDYKPGESARETAERLFKAEKDDAPTGNPFEALEKAEPKEQVDQKKPKKAQKAEKGEPSQEQVPQRLNAYERSVFEKLPGEAKKIFNKAVNALEADRTKLYQEHRAEMKASQAIREALEPYIPKMGQRGLTMPQAISELFAAQELLTNEETKLDTYVRLGQNLGISPEDVIAYRDGDHGGQVVAQVTPEIRQLQERTNQLESYIREQNTQRVINPIVQELEAVRDERDAQGEFLYPELFDGAFIERIKPLVLGRIQAHPGMSISEALKHSCFEVTGRQSAEPNTQQTRLSSQGGSLNQKATQAAVSVRGKSVPVSNGSDFGEVPKTALKDSRATMEWIMNNYGR